MKKIFLTTVLTTLISATTFAADSVVVPKFTDVSEESSFYHAIEYLRTNALVEGNKDGSFAPDRNLNRAEMLKMVIEGSNAKSEEIEAFSGSNCFQDVPAKLWFTKYVCYGKDAGFVRGYGDNTFKPSQAVTFAEALKMAFAAAEIEFTENEGDEAWYKNLVTQAGEEMYIPPTIFSFNQELTRAEMAELRTRMITKSKSEEEFEDHLSSQGKNGSIVVTYEIILSGESLSNLEPEVITTSTSSLEQ